MSMRLAVLYLQWDPEKHGGDFETLRSYVDGIRFCRKTYYVIDNKREGSGSTQLAEDVFAVDGDNSAGEFTGWQRGIETIRSQGRRFGTFLFCNDAFLAPGESFLREYGSRALLYSVVLRAMVGRLDSHGEPLSLLGYEFTDWVCSNCFFLPESAVDRLQSVVSIRDEDLDALLTPAPSSAVFRADGRIGEGYRTQILHWLTRRWHSRLEIGDETWDLLRLKVRAILNEALLTARVRELGFPVRNYGSKKYY